MIEPTTCFGTFWIPNNEDKKMFGTYTYKKDGSSVVEIHRCDYDKTLCRMPNYDVLWGEIGDGYPITLFNVSPMEKRDCSYFLFSVKYVLTNIHLQSLEDSRFDKCSVVFSHLNSWIKKNSFEIIFGTDKNTFVAKDDETIMSDFKLDDNLSVSIHAHVLESIIPFYSCNLTQETRLRFNVTNKISVGCFVDIVTEFAQFLSIALLSKQYPNRIYFANEVELLFKSNESDKPIFHLIPFNLLRDRMTSIICNWHKHYSAVSPICSHYINSLKVIEFEPTDFLIVAESLDGYHKRFNNMRDGKDVRKYEDGLKKLLDKFNDIDVVKKCNINSDLFTKTRNHYSHLYFDNNNDIPTGKELYNITQQGFILLSCCLLHLLGLTMEEINVCCNKSMIYNRISQ